MQRKLMLIIMSLVLVFTIESTECEAHATEQVKIEEETPSGVKLVDIEEEIEEIVSQYVGKTIPGVAIAVVKDGEIIFSEGYGYADISNQDLVDAKSTVFEWGSISKLFTYTSVMQLVEDGRLDLDEDIKTYLPDSFIQKLLYKETVTMRDIMNHSAGFGDYPFDLICFSDDQLVSLEEGLIASKPKQYYKVGTRSAYSNYAVGLAGYVVECVTNQSYGDYQKEYITNVLGMDHTSALSTAKDNPKILDTKAQGYISDGIGGFIKGDWSYISLSPAGAYNGTVEDLAQFAIALTTPSEECPLFEGSKTLSTMLSPSYDTEGEMVGTAHGFFGYEGEKYSVGHGGNTAYFSSQFAVVPEERFGIVVLTNVKGEINLMFELQDILIGKKDKSVELPEGILPSPQEVEGKYIPIERQEGNFVEFFKYMSLYSIQATGDNEITMSFAGYQGVYNQVEPYCYELVQSDLALYKNIYPILKFNIQDGKVVHIAVGNGVDLSSLPKGRSQLMLLASIIIALLSIVFFLLAPLGIAIYSIKRRKVKIEVTTRKIIRKCYMLIMVGTITVINNLVCISRLLINNFRFFDEFKPHIILNYVLIILATVLIAWLIRMFKNTNIAYRLKVLFIAVVILLVLLFGVLISWNFFNAFFMAFV